MMTEQVYRNFDASLAFFQSLEEFVRPVGLLSKVVSFASSFFSPLPAFPQAYESACIKMHLKPLRIYIRHLNCDALVSHKTSPEIIATLESLFTQIHKNSIHKLPEGSRTVISKELAKLATRERLIKVCDDLKNTSRQLNDEISYQYRINIFNTLAKSIKPLYFHLKNAKYQDTCLVIKILQETLEVLYTNENLNVIEPLFENVCFEMKALQDHYYLQFWHKLSEFTTEIRSEETFEIINFFIEEKSKQRDPSANILLLHKIINCFQSRYESLLADQSGKKPLSQQQLITSLEYLFNRLLLVYDTSICFVSETFENVNPSEITPSYRQAAIACLEERHLQYFKEALSFQNQSDWALIELTASLNKIYSLTQEIQNKSSQIMIPGMNLIDAKIDREVKSKQTLLATAINSYTYLIKKI